MPAINEHLHEYRVTSIYYEVGRFTISKAVIQKVLTGQVLVQRTD